MYEISADTLLSYFFNSRSANFICTFEWVMNTDDEIGPTGLSLIKTNKGSEEFFWLYRPHGDSNRNWVYYVLDTSAELEQLLMQQVQVVNERGSSGTMSVIYKLKHNQKALHLSRHHLPPRVVAEMLADEMVGVADD